VCRGRGERSVAWPVRHLVQQTRDARARLCWSTACPRTRRGCAAAAGKAGGHLATASIVVNRNKTNGD